MHQCNDDNDNCDDEIIIVIISACPILAKEQHTERTVCVCVCVCTQLHFAICMERGAESDKEHCYQHVPKSVQRSHEGTVTRLWNQHLNTDRIIPGTIKWI